MIQPFFSSKTIDELQIDLKLDLLKLQDRLYTNTRILNVVKTMSLAVEPKSGLMLNHLFQQVNKILK